MPLRRAPAAFVSTPGRLLLVLVPLLPAIAAPAAQPSLERRVRAALVEACGTRAGEAVRIEARDGVVTLSGSVPTLHERECVAIQAERVEGVSFLYPRTTVRPGERVSDAEIVERGRALLRDSAGLEGPAPLTVNAHGGRVVLAGVVRVPEDKYRAEAALRHVEGIVELENAIRVDPQQGLRKLEVQLQELFRVRQIPVENLRFLESEGRVVIEGRSHDVIAREVVEEFIRDLPGGRFVVDRMRLVLRPTQSEAGPEDR